MVRPKKLRRICFEPTVTVFKPRGVPACTLEFVELGHDEIEAIRLGDFEQLYQEDAAAQMKISRATFSRLIESARKKISDALLHGKAIAIKTDLEKS